MGRTKIQRVKLSSQTVKFSLCWENLSQTYSYLQHIHIGYLSSVPHFCLFNTQINTLLQNLTTCHPLTRLGTPIKYLNSRLMLECCFVLSSSPVYGSQEQACLYNGACPLIRADQVGSRVLLTVLLITIADKISQKYLFWHFHIFFDYTVCGTSRGNSKADKDNLSRCQKS